MRAESAEPRDGFRREKRAWSNSEPRFPAKTPWFPGPAWYVGTVEFFVVQALGVYAVTGAEAVSLSHSSARFDATDPCLRESLTIFCGSC